MKRDERSADPSDLALDAALRRIFVAPASERLSERLDAAIALQARGRSRVFGVVAVAAAAAIVLVLAGTWWSGSRQPTAPAHPLTTLYAQVPAAGLGVSPDCEAIGDGTCQVGPLADGMTLAVESSARFELVSHCETECPPGAQNALGVLQFAVGPAREVGLVFVHRRGEAPELSLGERDGLYVYRGELGPYVLHEVSRSNHPYCLEAVRL